jgi:anti-sigma B factor antagonist
MAMPQDLASPERGDVSVFFDTDETLVRLAGEVDLAMAEGLDFVAGQAIERGSPVRVDVSALTFLDSTGLILIARLVTAERQAGRTVRVEGANRRVHDLLDVAGLSPVLDLADGRAT